MITTRFPAEGFGGVRGFKTRNKPAPTNTKPEAAKAFNYRVVAQYNDERYVKKVPLSMDTVKLISMTKILSGDVLSEVTDTCLQFHGGWGYIEDFPIARAWRDQRLLRIGGGTTETMKYYLAKLMGF